MLHCPAAALLPALRLVGLASDGPQAGGLYLSRLRHQRQAEIAATGRTGSDPAPCCLSLSLSSSAGAHRLSLGTTKDTQLRPESYTRGTDRQRQKTTTQIDYK